MPVFVSDNLSTNVHKLLEMKTRIYPIMSLELNVVTA